MTLEEFLDAQESLELILKSGGVYDPKTKTWKITGVLVDPNHMRRVTAR